MNSVEAFFHMGGYGAFIWPSYILSAIVLVVLYFRSSQRLKRAERELDAMGPQDRRRRPARASTEEATHDT